MGNTFNTSTSTSEKILIEGIDNETGVKTVITVEPKAYEVLTEYFKERAIAECWHEQSGLNKPDVSVPLPEILKALDTTECEMLPSEWIKNEPNNVNYMGGFLTGVRWRERQ